MKTKLFLLALCITLVSCGDQATKPSSKSEAELKKEVTAAFDGLIDAILKRDEAKLRAMAVDDIVWGHTGGQRDDLEAFIKTNTNMNSNYIDFKDKDKSVRVYGDYALVRNLYDGIYLEPDSSKVKVEITQVTSWVNQDGTWKLVDRQGAMIEEAPYTEE